MSEPAREPDPYFVALGKKSAAVRAQRREERIAAKQRDDRMVSALVERDERSALGPTAFAAASVIVHRVLTGVIPVSQYKNASPMLRTLVDIGRLEAGEPTTSTFHATADLATLRDELRSRLSSVTDASSVADALPLDVATQGTEPTAIVSREHEGRPPS